MLENEMPIEELYEWNEYFAMENEAREAEQKKNKVGKSSKPKTGGVRPKRAKAGA